MNKSRWLAPIGVVFVLLVLIRFSGTFLVVNRSGPADVILVLGGETEVRPELGVQLLRAGKASRMVLDVPAATQIYRWSLTDLARQYVRQIPEAESIVVCPVRALSTEGETPDAGICLQNLGARRVLLVTSDYHTRRALSTFRRRLPQYEFFVAPAFDSRTFGQRWWSHREWAKTALSEWMKLIWWETVDRWRDH